MCSDALNIIVINQHPYHGCEAIDIVTLQMNEHSIKRKKGSNTMRKLKFQKL